MKKVTFASTNKIFTTYSKDEYDRSTIDYLLYRRSSRKVSNQEWTQMYVLLDIFKLYQMSVHKDSFKNNLYHTKP